MNDQQRKTIEKLLYEIKQTSFVEGYKDRATDEEAMGLLLSKYFGWHGKQILQATYYALEDSNFHKENETIEKLLNS
jgi:hypothetical protein